MWNNDKEKISKLRESKATPTITVGRLSKASPRRVALGDVVVFK